MHSYKINKYLRALREREREREKEKLAKIEAAESLLKQLHTCFAIKLSISFDQNIANKHKILEINFSDISLKRPIGRGLIEIDVR